MDPSVYTIQAYGFGNGNTAAPAAQSAFNTYFNSITPVNQNGVWISVASAGYSNPINMQLYSNPANSTNLYLNIPLSYFGITPTALDMFTAAYAYARGQGRVVTRKNNGDPFWLYNPKYSAYERVNEAPSKTAKQLGLSNFNLSDINLWVRGLNYYDIFRDDESGIRYQYRYDPVTDKFWSSYSQNIRGIKNDFSSVLTGLGVQSGSDLGIIFNSNSPYLASSLASGKDFKAAADSLYSQGKFHLSAYIDERSLQNVEDKLSGLPSMDALVFIEHGDGEQLINGQNIGASFLAAAARVIRPGGTLMLMGCYIGSDQEQIARYKDYAKQNNINVIIGDGRVPFATDGSGYKSDGAATSFRWLRLSPNGTVNYFYSNGLGVMSSIK